MSLSCLLLVICFSELKCHPLFPFKTMAGVGFEEFSVPPGSELALPPLFGGNILESELETEVEFADGGLPEEEDDEGALRQEEMTRRKCQALARRCKELEQVPNWQ